MADSSKALHVGESGPAAEESIILPGNATKRARLKEPNTAITATLAHARSKVALLTHPKQFRNPMLRHIRHVRKETHNGISADFVCGPTTCALYLSLQYHKLHPEYIYRRVRDLGKHFKLRVLLVLADIVDHRVCVHELTKMCLINDMTLICAGSEREAARYLETFRSYDGKGAEGIQERIGADSASRLNASLCSVRGINRTDTSTLAFTFGSFRDIAIASKEELRLCPGLGETKVSRLFRALNEPFRRQQEDMGNDNLDGT